MNEPQDTNEAACGGSALTAELGADLTIPDFLRNQRNLVAEKDAEIARLQGQLAEFQIVAYRREWDGDESDFGNWIYAEADERDHIGIWEPVYAKVPNV